MNDIWNSDNESLDDYYDRNYKWKDRKENVILFSVVIGLPTIAIVILYFAYLGVLSVL